MSPVTQTHALVDRPLLESCSETFMLGLCIWREARGENYSAKLGVAQSVLNRVRRPTWWGDSVMSVLRKKWQYSSLTDPKDPQLTFWPNENDYSWWECMQIAYDALQGVVGNPCPGADSYHDISIPPPKWATKENFVCQIGRLKFYNVDSDAVENS